MLQCVAVCCSVLRSDTYFGLLTLQHQPWCTFKRVAIYCSLLQHAAVCCSEAHTRVIDPATSLNAARSSALQYIAVCCSMLQHVAVRHIHGLLTLQQQAWCTSQYVAMCCSMLQRVAVRHIPGLLTFQHHTMMHVEGLSHHVRQRLFVKTLDRCTNVHVFRLLDRLCAFVRVYVCVCV